MCHVTHSHVWHDSFKCVPWLIHMCAMTDSHVSCDSFTCKPCIYDLSLRTRRLPMSTYVTWLIQMCAVTHSHVLCGSITYNPCIYEVSLCTHSTCEWVMAHIWMSHESSCDSFTCNPCIYDLSLRTRRLLMSHIWHDSFKCVPWLIHMCCVAHSHEILVSMTSAYVHVGCLWRYGVATVSRIDKIIGLFCRILSLL